MSEKPSDIQLETRVDDGTATSVGGTDIEKTSRYAGSTIGNTHSAEYKKRERLLLLKLDVAIMPFAVFLYLSAYLDRGNLGNARLQGLQANVLNNDDTLYSISLMCFFITYILFSIPGTLLAKQFNPSTSIATGAMIWSIAATCQAAAFNPAGLFVSRLFVGVGEAMFGQAMAFYLSLWYSKHDLAKRVGVFISAGALAGAFGGLISFGVNNIANSAIPQYKILFLIEGCPSVLLAILVYFLLPDRPETSKYLSEDERTLCLTRLNQQSSAEATSGIEWAGVRRCLLDWKTYVVSIAYSCMNLGLGSVGGFLPTIVKGFGYTNAQAQLYTVPPYAVALVFMLLLTAFSDRTQSRGLPIATVFIIGIVGWALLQALPSSSNYSARYFACICVVTAGYTNIPLIIAWQAGNTANESQRATSLGMLNSIGQCLSILASFLFPSAEGPQFVKGCSVNIAFQCLGLILASTMTVYYRRENKRRDQVEGGRPPKEAVLDLEGKFDKGPGFRYTP